jgi:hypothetical protein
MDELRKGIERIRAAERGEPPADRDYTQLLDGATTPQGVDLLAIEGKRTGRTNGGIPCDVVSGPCSCGAWH